MDAVRSRQRQIDDRGIRALAARLARLIAPNGGAEVRLAAARLGVPEVELCYLIECRPPWPALDVLAEICTAVVLRFGVDPGWLIMGSYDPQLHRIAETWTSDRARLGELVTDFLGAFILHAGPFPRAYSYSANVSAVASARDRLSEISLTAP